MRRHRFIALLSLCVLPVSDLLAGETGYNSYAIGQSFYVCFTSDQIEQTPKWKEDAPNPPVSGRRALELAEVRKNELVKDQYGLVWRVRSLELVPDGDDWYWLAAYEAHPKGAGDLYFATNLLVVVLMDETVPGHKASDDDTFTLDQLEDPSPEKAPSPREFEFRSSGNDGTYRVRFTSDDLKRPPEWKESDKNPPVSARQALELATARKREFVSDDETTVWEFDSLALTPAGEGQWFWEVIYSASPRNGGATGIPPQFSVTVFMNGTVPKHEEFDGPLFDDFPSDPQTRRAPDPSTDRHDCPFPHEIPHTTYPLRALCVFVVHHQGTKNTVA